MKNTILRILNFFVNSLNKKTGPLQTKVADPRYPTIYCDGRNQHVLMMPNGEIILGLLSTKVYDYVEALPVARFESIVNLATNEQEARKIYEADTPTD